MNNNRYDFLHHVIIWVIVNVSEGSITHMLNVLISYTKHLFEIYIYTMSDFSLLWQQKPFSVNTSLCDRDGCCCLSSFKYSLESCSDKLPNFSQSSWRHNPEDIILWRMKTLTGRTIKIYIYVIRVEKLVNVFHR
jgi:hypothetical protein